MKISEEKKIIKETVEKVTTGRICDCCKNKIIPKGEDWNGKIYDFFLITTHHIDWGNDSVDSWDYYDACSVECALKMTEKYLQSRTGFRNTGEIEIEHVNRLEDGSDRDYNQEIRY